MTDLKLAVVSFAAAIGCVVLLVLELVLDTETGPTADDPNDYQIRFDESCPT